MTIQILINVTGETNMQYELIVQAYYIDINSSPASVAYTRQCIESALVKIMTCRLVGAKPKQYQEWTIECNIY